MHRTERTRDEAVGGFNDGGAVRSGLEGIFWIALLDCALPARLQAQAREFRSVARDFDPSGEPEMRTASALLAFNVDGAFVVRRAVASRPVIFEQDSRIAIVRFLHIGLQ